MNFKDQLQKDQAAILTTQEFANLMTVDGIETNGIWDDVTRTAPAFYGQQMDTWGVNTVERLLFVSERDVPCPVPGQDMTINGLVWTVRDAQDNCGLLRLTLFRNED